MSNLSISVCQQIIKQEIVIRQAQIYGRFHDAEYVQSENR